jgi:hypothetical protein
MQNSFEEGEYDDMDGYDWVSFIDEYHCADYWYLADEYDPYDAPSRYCEAEDDDTDLSDGPSGAD